MRGNRWFPLISFQGKPDRVLADGDQVAVAQLLLDHGLAIDLSSVGAPEVADPEGSAAHLDPAVSAGRSRVAHHYVVVRRTTDADHQVRKRDDPTRERSR